VRALRFDPLVLLAGRLKVLDQRTTTLAPLQLNREQRDVLRAVLDNERVLVLKGRQVGVSTVCCVVDLAFAIAHPGLACAIVADTQQKAEGLLAKVASWAKSIGIPLTKENVRSIELANGATIDALSAVSSAEEGESRVGRSKSYALLHLSEVGFWRDDRSVFAALLSTALPGARVVVESTASAAENLLRELWRSTDNGWHKVFLSLEHHEVYTRDADDITDEQWQALQVGHGFTSRPHAAWWWHKVTTDFGGDLHRALREYPVRPDDCWSFAEGRWITSYTSATVRPAGEWTYYREFEPLDPAVFGVDTGGGLGADASAIAIVGQRSRRIYATFSSSSTTLPEFISIIRAADAQWSPAAVAIESNGIGQGVYQELRDRSTLPVVEQKSSAGEKHLRLTRLKLAIESGAMPVGPEVVAEMASSRISRPSGPRGAPLYEGRDDLLNALSFALATIEGETLAPPPEQRVVVDPRVTFIPPTRKKRAHVW
jgi:hypothetical protein